MVLSSGQDLHLGIRGLTDSGSSLKMTEQEGTIGVVIDRDLGIMVPGEMIGIVIDRDQLQDLQNKSFLLGALDVGVILAAK